MGFWSGITVSEESTLEYLMHALAKILLDALHHTLPSASGWNPFAKKERDL
jgi:hypothetical protein